MNIHQIISNDIKSKIADLGDVNNVAIEIPKNRDFGDFSTNAALVLARPLGKSPREIAEMILPKISELSYISDVSIAGPGFINIKLTDDFIVNQRPETRDQRPEIIDLDYAGYNIGKALHIGHLRTTVVGDVFNRIARFLGYKTRSYNHMGDWGRPMGLIIAWILESGKMPESVDDINYIYPASSERAKQDSEWMETARRITVELQNGNVEYRKIYDVFAKMSLDDIDFLLKRFNVLPLDVNVGERLVAEYVPTVDKILHDKKLVVLDNGAEIINVKNDDDNAPMPPIIWRSSAGAQTYAAADLTAIYYREKTDNPDKIIYFTDARQALHFSQIFRAAKMAEITDADLEHIWFGTITGNDGKPFKTRDGNPPSLNEMLDMTVDSVRKRALENDKDLDEKTIGQIGLAALKFNDLMHSLRSDYIFDPDLVTSFEGKTGPYILYTAVRLKNILKKSNHELRIKNHELNSDERNLLLSILDFGRIISLAFEKRSPDILANYAYDLCQYINTFYHNCPILREDISDETKSHRLAIVEKSIETLSTVIDLMGLEIPEKM